MRLSISFCSPEAIAFATLFWNVKSATCFLRSNISSCVCFIFCVRSWYLETSVVTPIVSTVRISPGSPPIAAHKPFAALPIPLRASIPAAPTFPQLRAYLFVLAAAALVRPTCFIRARLILYCSLVMAPLRYNLLSSFLLMFWYAMRLRKSALVILFFVSKICCSIWDSFCPCISFA